MTNQPDPLEILQAVVEGLQDVAANELAVADRLARYYGYQMAEKPHGDHEALRVQVLQSAATAKLAKKCAELATGYYTGLYVVRSKNEATG